MLLRNNTAIRPIWVIKPAASAGPAPILAEMSEADDLARRFLALWADYLNALMADPNSAEPIRRWLAMMMSSPGFKADDPVRPPDGAAPAASASGERDAAVAELARRIDELGERVAALEKRGKQSRKPGVRKTVGPRRGDRPSRG
jgi:hypothetical protein